MANVNPTPTYILRHENGTAVTAQEAYDAFMNTRVLIVLGIDTYEVISMAWYDNNSAQDDPTNVGYVKLNAVYNNSGTASISPLEIGDSSLVPEQQG